MAEVFAGVVLIAAVFLIATEFMDRYVGDKNEDS